MKYDVNDAEDMKGFELLPSGTYNMVVDAAKLKTTKAGNGEFIEMQLKVLDGEHEGRVLFHTFTMSNPNADAVAIGRSQLKEFLKCAGWTEFAFDDIQDLLGCKAAAVIKHKTDQYGTKARVSYFKPMTMPQDTTDQGNPF